MKKFSKYGLSAAGLMCLFSASAYDMSGVSGEIITVPGDGDPTEWSRSSKVYVSMGFGESWEDPSYNGAVTFVTDEYGNVFFNYPIGSYRTSGWVLGHIDGDKMSIDLPCAVQEEEGLTLYLAALDGNADSGLTMSDDQTFGFVLKEGAWVAENPSRYLGLVNSSGMFCDVADSDLVFEPFKLVPPRLPNSVKARNFAMVSDRTGHFVSAALSDGELWLGGLLAGNGNKNIWVKAAVENGKAAIPSGTYLGVLDNGPEDVYYPPVRIFMVGYKEVDQYDIAGIPEISVTVTSDDLMTIDNPFVYNTLPDYTTIWGMGVNGAAELRYQAESNIPMVPENPSKPYYSRQSEYIEVELPQLSTNGELMDPSMLYYRIYADDELMVLSNEEYIFLPETTLTEIPYLFTDYYDIDVEGAKRTVYIYRHPSKFGIQSVYYGGGVEKVSAIVYSDGTVAGGDDAVRGIEADEAVNTEYFDILGRRIDQNSRGLVITRTNGKSVKTIR